MSNIMIYNYRSTSMYFKFKSADPYNHYEILLLSDANVYVEI